MIYVENQPFAGAAIGGVIIGAHSGTTAEPGVWCGVWWAPALDKPGNARIQLPGTERRDGGIYLDGVTLDQFKTRLEEGWGDE